MPYKSIYSPASDSFEVEKSEFIGHIAPVLTEEDAVGFIDKIRSENRRARHNCYAYALKDGSITRYSDDGEPQGTAGSPILDVILKNGLTDVAIVVTRYFGGILLGKGGLTRAYSTAASLAVAAADIMELYPAYKLSVESDYSFYDRLIYVLPEFGAKITDTEFTDKVKITLAVRAELCEKLIERINDVTGGSAELCKSHKIDFDFSK